MSRFTLLHLHAVEGDAPALANRLRMEVHESWRAAGQAVWGTWQGLFGIAANELLVVLAGAHDLDLLTCLDGIAGVVERRPLRATVRPVETAAGRWPACTREGLYVFRRFDVDHDDVDEAVQLSREAWRTFEVSDYYQSEPMGLFADVRCDREFGTLLLVTWYDGFASWEASRHPAPAAREHFRRRHALIRSTVAVAARLVGEPA